MTLWQHVLSWSHVFLLLTLNIYSTADRDIWCLFIICSWSLNRAINSILSKTSLLGLCDCLFPPLPASL